MDSPTPPTYLALIAFDCDDLGRRRVLADPDRTPQALTRFAKKAATRIEAERFYLAGDEGLAMAPAETVLDLVFLALAYPEPRTRTGSGPLKRTSMASSKKPRSCGPSSAASPSIRRSLPLPIRSGARRGSCSSISAAGSIPKPTPSTSV